MNKENMREDFEAFAKSNHFDQRELKLSDNGGYVLPSVNNMWVTWNNAWQAALSQQQASGDELVKGLNFVYGLLWHVNNGVDIPASAGVISISPEAAAYEARKYLLQMFPGQLERGIGINTARDHITAIESHRAKQGDSPLVRAMLEEEELEERRNNGQFGVGA